MKRCLVVFTLCCLFTACQKDAATTLSNIEEEEPAVKSFPNVDQALWPYFQEYENVARARGITINLNNTDITGVIQEIATENVAGTCSFGSHAPEHITIDAEFWRNANNFQKEFVVFHELGHCHLFRDHREDAFTNGTCVSLMRSGVEDCRDNYNAATRSRYLDELFRPQNF